MAQPTATTHPAARRDAERRSAQWPWARAGLSGLVAMLLPFTWVLQIDGCTQTLEGTRTGVDLLRSLYLEPLDLWLALVLLAFVVFAPRWAAMIPHASTRLVLHVAGLVSTAALAFEGLSLLFGAGEIRTLQPAGYLVLLALLASCFDAALRVVFGSIEWSAERVVATPLPSG
jgi:hypothetical protein